MKRRVLLVGLLAAVLLAGGVYVTRGAIAMAAMPRVAAEAIGADLTADLPDGLHAFVCGSGSPLADAERSGPCLAVIAGQQVILVDAGEGAAKTLNLNHLAPGDVDAVLLTHLHSDHIDGLGALALQRWAGGARAEPLPLIGTAGVDQVAQGLNLAYARDRDYRVAHHGPKTVPLGGFGLAARTVPTPAPGKPIVIMDEGGLKVTAFAVDHAPVVDAVGYRFDYKGRSLAVSGDTRRSASLEQAAKGVDLLVHEALSPRLVAVLGDAATRVGRPNVAQIMADIPDYHASPEDAADSAQAAGASALLLTHMIPPLPVRALEGPFLGEARRRFDGPLWLARDGDIYSLPADNDRVERKRASR